MSAPAAPAALRALPAPAWLGAASGLLLTLLAFAPGGVGVDASSQLTQGRLGFYFDMHPPLFSWLWGRLDRLMPGPGLMFALHAALFWAALGALAAARTGRRPLGAAVVLVIGLFPPVLDPLREVVKDVAMGVGLLWATLALTRLRAGGGRGWALVLALGLGWAAAVRLNALPAVVPLGLWGGALCWRRVRPAARPRAQLLAGLALSVAVTGGAAAANRALSDARVYPEQFLWNYDLSGISLRVGRNLLPAWQVERPGGPDLDTLRRHFRTANPWALLFEPLRWPPVRPSVDPREILILRRAWLRAVLEHPGAWLAHRWATWREELGLCAGPPYAALPRPDPLPLGAGGPWQRPLQAWVEGARPTFLYRAALYLLAALALGWRWRRDPLALALAASAGAYALSFLPISAGAEHRYMWWPLLAALCLPLARARRPGGEPTTARRSGGSPG